MPTYEFTITTPSRLCLTEGGGSYVLERNIGGKWFLVRVDGAIARVYPSSPCVSLTDLGEYRITHPEETSCPVDVPSFEVTSEFVESGTRTTRGSESVALDSSSVAALTPPANANHAEIHVWTDPMQGGIIWTVSGIDPSQVTMVGHRTVDGGVIELESAEDIANFRASTLDGFTGSVYVTYYEIITHLE